jgi:hypothetical protein
MQPINAVVHYDGWNHLEYENACKLRSRPIFKKTEQAKNKKNNGNEISSINKEYEPQPIWG